MARNPKSAEYLQTALSVDKSNRQILTSDDLMTWLFSEGCKQADIWYQQIAPTAQMCGYKTMFKESYLKRRAVSVREEFGLNYANPLGDSIPALSEYAEYLVPPTYMIDEAKGISRFDQQTLEYRNIFPHPVIIAKRYKNIFTGNHSVKIVFYDNGDMGECVVPLYEISNSNQIQHLTKNGIRVTSESAKFLVMFLSEFLSINVIKIPILRSTSTLGWVNKEFLPYSSDNIEFEGNDEAMSTLKAARCQGDFEQWKKYVSESCRNDFVRAYMATSFASPLLVHTKKPIFITHLWGKSGTAKTVALYLALSVWGEPVPLSSQWNGTVVATEQKSALLNNIPMSMNESELLHGARGTFQNHSDFIYMYCEGRNKPRGAKEGGTQLTYFWNSCCLSNGEGSLVTEKSKEGELNRVLEFQTDNNLFDSEKKAIEIVNFAKSNFGYAGKLFVENCLDYDLLAYWNRFFEETQKHGTGKQAGQMASLLLGDMLMRIIIYGADEEKAFNNSLSFLVRIKGNMKTNNDIDISARAKDYFDGWMAQNINNFISESAKFEPTQIYGELKNGKIYVINSVFNDMMVKQGYNLGKVKKDFKTRGFFADMRGDAVTVVKKIKGSSVNCYCFERDSGFEELSDDDADLPDGWLADVP